jgi:hypothetical protein
LLSRLSWEQGHREGKREKRRGSRDERAYIKGRRHDVNIKSAKVEEEKVGNGEKSDR